MVRLNVWYRLGPIYFFLYNITNSQIIYFNFLCLLYDKSRNIFAYKSVCRESSEASELPAGRSSAVAGYEH